MCCFTCHVSLCLLEPTGNLQIMEAQFHNSLNPFMGKHNGNSACFLQTCGADTQTGTLGRRLYNHNVFWKQDSQVFFFFFFAYGPCNNIHQFEGCFLLGQVSLNGVKNFNGCIVEYLNFISLSAKTLENLSFILRKRCEVSGLIVRTAMY